MAEVETAGVLHSPGCLSVPRVPRTCRRAACMRWVTLWCMVMSFFRCASTRAIRPAHIGCYRLGKMNDEIVLFLVSIMANSSLLILIARCRPPGRRFRHRKEFGQERSGKVIFLWQSLYGI